MQHSNPRTTRAICRSAARHWAAWQAAGAGYGRSASDWVQLRLPLMTMVGLTLIGLYDCTASARLPVAEAAPTVHTAPVDPAACLVRSAPVKTSAVTAFNPVSLGVATAAPVRCERPSTLRAEVRPVTSCAGFRPESTAPPIA